MDEFVNTADILGDDEVCDQLIMRTITEYKENRITKLGKAALSGCSALTVLEVPNVTTVEAGALQGVSVEVLDLPKVTLMASEVCRGTKGVKVLNAPELLSIDGYAFEASGLTTLNCPKLQTIGVMTFANSKVSEVCFPALTSVTRQAFSGCTDLAIADLFIATGIGINAFANCTALSTMILRSENLCGLGGSDSIGSTLISSGAGYIYVPRALLEDYKAATNWSVYAAQFRALEDYTVDGTVTGEFDKTKI